MTQPFMSICIPHRKDASYERSRNFEYIKASLKQDWSRQLEAGFAEIVIANSNSDLPFSRSAARNNCAKKASGHCLVFLDADSHVSFSQCMDVVERIFRAIDTSVCWGLPYDSYWVLTEESTKDYIMEQTKAHLDAEFVFDSNSLPPQAPSFGGCVIVSRSAFEEVGGYDERFRTWGDEDRAFALSLETMTTPVYRTEGCLYHLWHPVSEEDRFGNPGMAANRELYSRYLNAAGNRQAMKDLIEKRPPREQ